jgi:hypothetical protein
MRSTTIVMLEPSRQHAGAVFGRVAAPELFMRFREMPHPSCEAAPTLRGLDGRSEAKAAASFSRVRGVIGLLFCSIFLMSGRLRPARRASSA